MHPSYGYRSRLASLLFALVLGAQLLGCAALAERRPGDPTQAYADTQATTLARTAAASLSTGPLPADGLSGFSLQPRGEFAFDARIALVTRAERSIDVQY